MSASHSPATRRTTTGRTATRRTALLAGALYLLTVVTSIPALALKEPGLNDPSPLAVSGGEAGMLWAVVLELVLAAACVGTAIALFPVVRRASERAALGFIAARTIEAALIGVGVLAMLSLVTVSRAGDALGGAEGVTGVSAGLVAIHDWAFLVGPGLIPAANALLLGYALYRSRLVPRILPIVGFVGAACLIVSFFGTLFGLFDQVSAIAGLMALPVAAWEIGLGVWLVVKGFRVDALAELDTTAPDEQALETTR